MPLLSSLRDPSLAILDRAASATMSTAATSAHIIHHATARISEILSQPDLRRRLFSAFCSKLPSSDQIILKPLKLAAETVENAMSISNPSVQSSSLRLAEKLLVSFPENPFSSFLLSLIYSLCHCPVDAAISLLDLFCIDPLLARSEIAPSVFEELFLIHLLPVLQWFNDHRSKILSPNTGYDFDDRSICDDSVVISSTRLLSQMSGDQASELTELERAYEEVLDANCRVFAEYFQEVLANTDGKCVICLPPVILEKIERVDKFENSQDEKIKSGEPGFENGRYNPMWGEEEKSVELQSRSGKSLSKFPSFCPERVSPKVLISQRSLGKSKTSQRNDFDSELDPSSADNMSDLSSSDSEAEIEVKNKTLALFDFSQAQKQKQTISAETSSPDLLMAETPGGGKHTPPKDFVCPITTHIFNDPVTLETGQTYERKAIQEWLGRGNCTCPITRQKLQSTQLPKTNYVLKRLIANWREQNPSSSPSQSENSFPECDPVFNSMVRSTSPNSVIGQAIFDGNISELRLAITNLCMSEILEESEVAVIQIEKFWRANMELEMQTMLSKPAVVNGFVEILFNSVDPRVLTATVFLLSELGSRDSAVIQTLTRVDSDVECIVALFKKGLLEAVVLIYLLRPSAMSLIEMDIVDTLLTVPKKREDEMFKMCMKPKTAALILMGQIIGSSEETSIFEIVTRMISEKAIEVIVTSMQADLAEERIAAVGILRRSMQLEGKCRNIIAEKAELASLLESLMGAKDGEWFEIVHFLSELVKLKSRTFNEQVLHIIKDEGTSSTMHTLLVYLQTALQDQSPIVAGLLLQLDLLAEPRKMSIYREEAIDTLIACLRNSDFPAVQITASETILALQGRFSSSGKSLARAYLLKRAGLDKRYKALMKKEQLSITSGEVQENLLQEEEKAAEDWERKMAYVLVSHEFGLLFEALAEGLKSRYEELCSACFVSATWLVHMLNVLPDTGIRGAARVCLLKRFVSIFKSAKDTEDRVLSMLALNSFISDADGMRDVTPYIKDILKGLRELRKSSTLAFDMLKVFSEGHDSSADLWNHKELVQEDCSSNGEVLSIFCFKDKIFSGHSDGTIKVWTGRGSILHLAQETREHTKAVTSLAILHSGDKLYSGSLDRTVRVWSISSEVMNCTQVHDMKDPINSLVVSNSISCFIPQGAGIKMHSWGGGSKLLNPNKYTKCLALFHGKLYCGCQDNSIQEVDLATGTLGTIQSGSRKLLGKANPIHALHVHDGLIYAASSPLDGAAVKIWRASNYSMVGSLPSTLEVRAMAVSSDLIYLGCKGGAVEVWCRKKYNRVETIQTGSNAKILCMALDADEDVLIIGKSDGRIQAWGLS